MVKWMFATLLMFVIQGIPAQTIRDILNKLNLYEGKYPEETVYLQSDRDFYAPGDIIWFKAFIVQNLGEARDLGHDLEVGLVDPYGQEVAHAKYLINEKQVNGDITIPDLVNPGQYMLMAYTNWMKNSPADRVFMRHIIVEKKAPDLVIKLKLDSSRYSTNSTMIADITCLDQSANPVEAALQYKLLANGEAIVQGKNKTSKDGNARLSIKLPDKAADARIELTVSARAKENETETGILIPMTGNLLQVHFYPEGGNLLYENDSKIAFKALNSNGQPVAMEGDIMEGIQKIMSIRCNRDGIGSFNLKPEWGKTYYLRITKPADVNQTFRLPRPLVAGVSLAVKQNSPDKLILELLQINQRPQTYHIIGQTMGRIYWLESHRIGYKADLTVSTADFPGGVYEFTVFDSTLSPQANRMVYLNPSKKLNIEIIPDKSEYDGKGMVHLTIHTKDEKGKPVQAVLGLSATNTENTPLYSGNTDLYSQINLVSVIKGCLLPPRTYFEPAKADSLDNLLLTGSFKLFNWKDVLQTGVDNPAFTASDSNDSKADFNLESISYCANTLKNDLERPGMAYPVQMANDTNSWSSIRSGHAVQHPFGGRLTVAQMIYQIKPYDVRDGKIYFRNAPITSINFLDGAIIALNGKLLGSSANLLDGLIPADIDHIHISMDPMDIQKYTAMNNAGVIEIYTKVSDEFKRGTSAGSSDLNKEEVYKKPSEFKPSARKKEKSRRKDRLSLPETIWWSTRLSSDEQGNATVNFENTESPARLVIRVEGLTEQGLAGGSTLVIPVK